MLAYAVFAVVIAWLPLFAKVRTGWQLPVHLIDVGVISYLMYFLQSPSILIFILYVFVLLSATYRWNWRGALWTTIFVFALEIILFLTRSTAVQFIVQSSFLFIVGGMFAFFGVGRERSGDRLDQIATWRSLRAKSLSEIHDGWLDASLAHVASVMQIPRLLVVWEIAQEPFVFTVLFENGKSEYDRTPADAFGNLVSVDLQDATFASEAIESNECFSTKTIPQFLDPIIEKSLQSKFKISSVCSAPFSGEICKGRVFLLDRSNWDQDYLTLADIIAARLCIELEYYAICLQVEEGAAIRERIRLSRDLHDGILQSLAAVALQLKIISSNANEKIQDDLDSVRRLISSEQRHIRKFVDGRLLLHSRRPIKLRDVLSRKIRMIENQWRCSVNLQSITPLDAMISNHVTAQIGFPITEAVSNAVQHGNASLINIAIRVTLNRVELRIVDNGHGLPGTLGIYNQAELSTLNIGPQSIVTRITELGGTLSLVSSRNGVERLIAFPCDGNASNESSYKAHAFG